MKQKDKKVHWAAVLWTILAAMVVSPMTATACTAFVVGKKASATLVRRQRNCLPTAFAHNANYHLPTTN